MKKLIPIAVLFIIVFGGLFLAAREPVVYELSLTTKMVDESVRIRKEPSENSEEFGWVQAGETVYPTGRVYAEKIPEGAADYYGRKVEGWIEIKVDNANYWISDLAFNNCQIAVKIGPKYGENIQMIGYTIMGVSGLGLLWYSCNYFLKDEKKGVV